MGACHTLRSREVIHGDISEVTRAEMLWAPACGLVADLYACGRGAHEDGDAGTRHVSGWTLLAGHHMVG